MRAPVLLHDPLVEAASARPRALAVADENAALDFAQLHVRAASLAAWMREQGVRRGDRVLIRWPSSVDTAVAVYSTLMAGAVFAVIDPTVKAEKLSAIVANADPRLILGENGVVDGLARAAMQEGAPAPETGTIDLDPAALVYTSGSTGDPKGVTLSHRAMTAAATSILSYLDIRPDDRILCALPLSFDYGLYQLLMAVQIGASVFLRRGPGFPYDFLLGLGRNRISVLPCVPTMMALMLSVTKLEELDLESVRILTNTGAAMPPAFVPRLRAMFPRARIFSMYGLTECKRVSYLDPDLLDARPASVGRPMPNVEVFVVDAQGRFHDRDAEGELVVRGSNLMSGYFRDPEGTARVLRPGPVEGERVLFTGDHFRIDAEGFLYFLGRRDDLFKCRGERVSRREIEDVLYALDSVVAARVQPVPHPVLGNAIHAEVVVSDPAVDESRILRHCREHLEDRLVPQEVRIVDRLPVSATGKIRH